MNTEQIISTFPRNLQRLNATNEINTRKIELKAAIPQKKPAAGKTPPRIILNTMFGQVIEPVESYAVYHGYPLWLDDILNGVARLDWYRTDGRSIPLSVKRLRNILQYLPEITTFNISAFLRIQERQARRYMTALTIAMPKLEEAFKHAERFESYDSGRVDEYDDEPHIDIAAMQVGEFPNVHSFDALVISQKIATEKPVDRTMYKPPAKQQLRVKHTDNKPDGKQYYPKNIAAVIKPENGVLEYFFWSFHPTSYVRHRTTKASYTAMLKAGVKVRPYALRDMIAYDKLHALQTLK